MAKELRIKDYNNIRLLFVFLLLISPLQIQSDDFYDDLECFDFSLFFRLSLSRPEENIIVSPFALTTLLILIRMTSNARVASEIDNAFNLIDESNAVITQKFRNLLKYYKHQHIVLITNKLSVTSEKRVLNTIEMDANGTINAWSDYDVCRRAWQLSSPGKPTELVLSTEIHFTNLLLKYSVEGEIAGEPFYVSKTETINADMLLIEGKLRYADIPQLHSKVVELPYSDGDTTLLILVPNKNNGLMELEKDLRTLTVAEILTNLKEEFIKLKIPKFITTVEFQLENDLKSLGLGTMFGILCDSPQFIRVSELNYKARFVLNDKSAREDPLFGVNLTAIANVKEVTANHPFVYILKSSKNVIYLIGRFYK